MRLFVSNIERISKYFFCYRYQNQLYLKKARKNTKVLQEQFDYSKIFNKHLYINLIRSLYRCPFFTFYQMTRNDKKDIDNHST